MPRVLRAIVPAAAKAPVAALRRRRQQIVVRAPGSVRAFALDERRVHSPTLPGLGFREEADTIPVIGGPNADEVTPVSHVRTRVAVLAEHVPTTAGPVDASARVARARPVTLLDDVHDGLARDYLAEARALLASGIFKGG